MKYAYLLFDADNTLFDFNITSHKAFDDMISHFGLEPKDDYYKIYKPLNSSVWKELESGEIDLLTVKTKRWELFWSAIGQSFNNEESNRIYLSNLVKHSFLLDETLEVLEALNEIKSITMHIITNGMKEAQRPRIKKLGIKHFFETITVSEEIAASKPSPAFFDEVFNKIPDATKDQCLVIGDGLYSDIKGGLHYGLDTCWYNPKELVNETNYKPKYEIASLKEILNLI